MKKFLCIFLLLTLFACADSMDYSYKFKDLTINIPVDAVLESKVITGDYTDLRGDDYGLLCRNCIIKITYLSMI